MSKLNELFLFISITLLLIFVESFINCRIIKKYKKVNHAGRMVFRIVIALINCWPCWDSEVAVLELFILFSFQAITFWFWFDLSLNILMGWQYDYIGNTARTDKFVRFLSGGAKNSITYLLARGICWVGALVFLFSYYL